MTKYPQKYWTVSNLHPYDIQEHYDKYFQLSSVTYKSITNKDEAHIFHYQKFLNYYNEGVEWARQSDTLQNYDEEIAKYTLLLAPYKTNYPEEFL